MVLHPHPRVCTADSPPSSCLLPPCLNLTIMLGVLLFTEKEAYLLSPVLKVKVVQSCLTLCGPMDYTAHRIFQASIPE